MVSVDTIRAYTYINIDINYLQQTKWRKWVCKNNTISYFKKYGALLFWYYPHGVLLIKFSVPKFFYGTNAMPFNLDHAGLLVKLVNQKIKMLFPNIPIKSFEDWICTEIHPFIHYSMANEKDKMIYLDCFKKMQYPRLKKRIFATGMQARNGSYALNIYSKYDEVKSRVTNKSYPASNEDIILLDGLKNVLRFEYQVKKAYLRRRYKNNRTIKDVLTKQFCRNLLLDAIKKVGLVNRFLHKDEVLKKIENEFGKVKACNLIKFIIDLNETPLDFVNAKYPKKTRENYIRELKTKGINPIYLQEKVSRKMDFAILSKQCINFSCQFLYLLLLIITSLIKWYLAYLIAAFIFIKYMTLPSVSNPPSFYLEDGG